MILRYVDEKIGNTIFAYKIIYKKQKNIILSIKNNIVNISAPNKCTNKIINDFISDNIIKIKDLILKYKKNKLVSFFNENSFVYLFGCKLKIILLNKNIHTKIINNIIFMKNVNDYNKQVKLLYCFLKSKYICIFLELLEEQLKKTDKSISKLKVRIMNSKWGIYYSSEKMIVLNIKLIHFNKEIIKHVILHEIAHINYHYHDKKFWSYVAYYDQNYQFHNNILKKYYV